MDPHVVFLKAVRPPGSKGPARPVSDTVRYLSDEEAEQEGGQPSGEGEGDEGDAAAAASAAAERGAGAGAAPVGDAREGEGGAGAGDGGDDDDPDASPDLGGDDQAQASGAGDDPAGGADPAGQDGQDGDGGVPEGFGPHNVEVGHHVAFRAGEFRGAGKVASAGDDGCTVADKTGREHRVHWSEVTGHNPGA